MVLANLWKLGPILTVYLPWYLILASIAVVDWVIDWVFLLTLGLFCHKCAGFFIWTFNIALIPFTLIGFFQRFLLETYALVVDGWMLFFWGSGCYLRFGHDCFINKRVKDRNTRTYFDIPWFSDIEQLFSIPEIEKASDIINIRRSNR